MSSQQKELVDPKPTLLGCNKLEGLPLSPIQ